MGRPNWWWKEYYLKEFDKRKLVKAFEKYPKGDTKITPFLKNGVFSFPHTALKYTADMLARIVTSLHAEDIHKVIALGVMHGPSKPYMEEAIELKNHVENLKEGEKLNKDGKKLFNKFKGAFTPSDNSVFGNKVIKDKRLYCDVIRENDKILLDEFSLDNFLRALEVYFIHYHVKFEVLPLYIFFSKNYANNSFDIANEIAKRIAKVKDDNTALLCTGDLAHYGTEYDNWGELGKITSRGLYFDGTIKESMNICSGGKDDDYKDYFDLSLEINNDQKHVLPVVSEYFKIKYKKNFNLRFFKYKVSDYSEILKAKPNYVASIMYGLGKY